MHELGIVTYVADAVEKIAKEQKVEKISSVILEIGEVSGIVPEYLVDCWDYFKKRYPALEQSVLEYETTPAATICTDCKKEYPTIQYGKQCPYCKSTNTYLLRGRECNIKELIVEED